MVEDSKPSRLTGEVEAWISSIRVNIPYVGNELVDILTVQWARTRDRRLHESFLILGSILKKLGEDKIDYAYLNTEEFQQVLITCVEGIQRERTQEKRRAFVNILANALTSKPYSDRERAEWFAAVLGRQSKFHLLVLQAVASDTDTQEAIIRAVSDPGDRQALIGCAKDLTGPAFITEFKVPPAGTDDVETLRMIFGEAQLTANGEQYAKWLSEPST